MINYSIPMSSPDIGTDEQKEILSTFKTGWFSQGKITKKFERALSDYLSSNISVMNSGSSALLTTLIAHGIKPNDNIIVPAFTFIASSSTPKMLGANIIPADIDPETLNMTPESIEKIVKKRKVKAVIVVDVAGLPVDLDPIIELSKKYNFILIEDAAEAFGSEYKKRKLGSFKHTTIFSFHIAKLITTIEGGCVASKDKKFIEKISQIREHGSTEKKYVHQYVSSNFRITDLQSAIGLIQLKKVSKYLKLRNEISSYYKDTLHGLSFPIIPKYATKHSYMLFFAIAKDFSQKNRIVKYLNKNKIDARSTWLPIHLQPCNPELKNFRCKQAENVFQKSLTLPIYNSMKVSDAQKVVKILNKFKNF